RPLWEFYVFEGMKNNEIGLYSKMHHACIDGGAGAALTSMIYDITPVPRQVEPPTAPKVAQEPRDIAANLIDSYQALWTQPFDASAAPKSLELPRTGKSDLGSILFDNAMFQIETAVKFASSVPTILKSLTDVVGKISDPKSRDSLASMPRRRPSSTKPFPPSAASPGDRFCCRGPRSSPRPRAASPTESGP